MSHILAPAVFSHQGGILWARKALLPSMRECSQPQLCRTAQLLWLQEPGHTMPWGTGCTEQENPREKTYFGTVSGCSEESSAHHHSPRSRVKAIPGPELQHPEVLSVVIFCFQVDLLPKGSTQLLQKTPPAREQVINPLAYRDVSGINKKHFKLLNPQRIVSHKYFIENSYKRFN